MPPKKKPLDIVLTPDIPKMYLYLRCSTDKQDVEVNKTQLMMKAISLNMGCNIEYIVDDGVSGHTRSWEQRKLGQLVELLKENDVIITSELSRIDRVPGRLYSFLDVVGRKKVKLYLTKTDFAIDGSLQSDILIGTYSMAARIERELTVIRITDGLKEARRRGTNKLGQPLVLGRPRKSKLDEHLEEIREMIKNGVKFKFIAEKFNCGNNLITTFCKKNELKDYSKKK